MSGLLPDLVFQEMGSIIREYGLSCEGVTDHDVLLRHNLYVLRVSEDLDGLSIIYYDILGTEPVGYNVLLYLINRRRELLTSVVSEGTSQVVSQLRSIASDLQAAARDILAGEKAWMDDYRWPPIDPGSFRASLAKPTVTSC